MSGDFIICDVCGFIGRAGNLFTQDTAEKKLFAHIGHDPYRGQMYYCCPSCRILLTVDPMDMLKRSCVTGVPGNYDRGLLRA